MNRSLNVFKVRESGNTEFWVANIIVLISTVLGVYLAAQAGYKTAMEFEVSRADRDGYYLRRALLDEVKENLEKVDEWGAGVEKVLRNRISADYFLPTDTWYAYFSDKGGWKSGGNWAPDEIKMNTFVWETMKQQNTTFQLSPKVLSGVRRYYDNMEGNGKDVRSQEWKAAPAAKAIVEDTRKMRAEIVPIMEKEMTRLQGRLAAKGVPLDE
jgi:hypothetical protein